MPRLSPIATVPTEFAYAYRLGDPVSPDGVVPATEADVIERAAELIDEYGLTKNQVGNPGIGYCLWGALRAASYELSFDGSLACNALTEVEDAGHYGHTPLSNGGPSYACVRWNDLPSTTPGDVTDCLRLTAKDLRA